MNSSIVRARPTMRCASPATPIRAASRTVERSSSARHASACSSAANTDRGNSRSSSRNSAARLQFDHAAVGAQVGLVGAGRAQHQRPGRRRVPGQHAGGEHPRGHVHPLERAAEDEEQPALVAAHRGVGQAEDHRRALADEPEQRVRAVPAGHRALLRQRVVGDVERLPDLGAEHLAGAAGVLPGRRQRADDRARAGRGRRRAWPAPARCRPRPPASASPSARAGWRRRGARRSTGPRAAAGCARRGCGRCRRPARRSGRSRTATRRSGSARRPSTCWPLLLLLLRLADDGVAERAGVLRRAGRRAGRRR